MSKINQLSKINRRNLLKLAASGITGAMFAPPGLLRPVRPASAQNAIVPRAKRIVYLFQAGGPSQLETFDPKPGLVNWRGVEFPPSVQGDRRITTMTSVQKYLAVANALVDFSQYGNSGLWVSDLLPHIATVADDLCHIKTTNMEAINHDPATNMAITGSQLPGRPSIGAWVSMALGTANPDLPSFVTMTSDTKVQFVQPLTKRLWSSAFLPVNHQGVSLRPGDRPVLFLDDETSLADASRRQLYDAIAALNQEHFATVGDPEILQRNHAYDIAANMQNSIVELADLSQEPEEVFELYGPQSRTAGTFAANCLRARRLLERDVRFVLLMHRGWDHHYNQTAEITKVAADIDQPTAALIKDLKRTGLLDETLFIWGGEFGRTAYSQGDITNEDHGRDHHPYCFTTLLAGAGVRPGITYGETDDFSYNIVENPVHIHDLHATILHILGVNHTELTFRHEGRDHRLTDLGGKVVTDILS